MTSAGSSPGKLVVGIGNPLRGDDAAGLVAARQVRAAHPDGVTVLEESSDGTALMEAWDGADTVILVDAVRSGAVPGTVHRLDAGAGPLPAGYFSCSTHAIGPAEAIELSRALGRLPRRLVVYGIEGRTFAVGAALSPEVEAAAGEVAGRVLRELDTGGP